jgi:hypothetical protein
MIILRQKIFTFQDKKAWEELKTATNNFTTLPNGRGKMNARDVVRFKKWAELVDQGRMNEVDWNEAKKVFEHIDLPETARGLEHLSHKYRLIQDPEFQDRYENIMSGDSFRKNMNLNRKLANRADRESYRSNNPAEVYKRYDALIDKNLDRLNETTKLSFPLFEGGEDAIKSSQRRYLLQSNRADKKYRKRGIGGPRTKKYIANILHKDNVSVMTPSQIGRNYFDSRFPNHIYVSSYNPAVLLHEWGHQQNYKRGYYPGFRFTDANDTLSQIAEENMASSRALARIRGGVKRGEVSPGVEKRIRKSLDSALESYTRPGIHKLFGGIKKAVRK